VTGYHILNYFFFFFHTAFTLFNIFGWVFKKTRKWNLLTLFLTAFSWFILGIWYGWGYCVCTQWHWQVREKLDYHDQSTSYIHFLVLKLTGINFNPRLVENITVTVFFASLLVSLWLNVRDYQNARRQKPGI
jgi:hypothetical protein